MASKNQTKEKVYEKYLAYPPKEKGKKGKGFFELARKHMITSKDPRNRTLSQDIDKILYGA